MELVEIGSPVARLNANETKILSYSVEVKHKGLNEFKVIKGTTESIIKNKVEVQLSKWDEKYQKKIEKKKAINEATRRTVEAREKIREIEQVLEFVYQEDYDTIFKKLKKNDKYPVSKPKQPKVIDHIVFDKQKPKLEDFKPKLNIFDQLLKTRKNKKLSNSKQKYENAYNHWKLLEEQNLIGNKKIDETNKKNNVEWEKKLTSWKNDKKKFINNQKCHNKEIDNFKKNYEAANKEFIERYCQLILQLSVYPDTFPKKFTLEFDEINKIMLVDYELPAIERFPNIKEVKYIVSKKEVKYKTLTDKEKSKMFNDTLYKITLRSIYELFLSDEINEIESINFNGWINAINKGTGKKAETCILSLLVNKNEFMNIDLQNIEPKNCFKIFKGVGSSKLSGVTPIQPIMTLDKSDKRFVKSYNVSQEVADTNLAALDWQDFEHLVREIFEKEFSINGGEVKVTQASRDGGVDAIAFDPDPIRGGKIIIQAKRYTNIVGIAAVRDLYGTVINEGATKGILVSTSNYGTDAYNFAKDKPITLINGANLLHLLEKHGHRAKIDLAEAKLILAERDNNN